MPTSQALAMTRRRDPRARSSRRCARRAAARRRSSRACTSCPRRTCPGHFNVLRGYVRPLGVAGVKVVGDFYRNYERGLPSELALLNLFDPTTGAPIAIIDASDITDMRTGAVTAIGAQAPRAQATRRCSATSARAARRTGTCGCSTRSSTSTRSACIRAGRKAATRSRARLERDLGKQVVVTDDWESCVRGADIVVEASRLEKPEPKLKTAWIAKGACVIPYGTMSAVELSLTDIMDKIVMDDWGQAQRRPVRRAARARRQRAGSRSRTCTPSSARSSPGSSPAASATTRRTCSGTAACRSPTSRSARRCSRRRSASASASACAFADSAPAHADRQRAHVFGHARPARPTGTRSSRWALRQAELDWPFVDHDAAGAARRALGARRPRRAR